MFISLCFTIHKLHNGQTWKLAESRAEAGAGAGAGAGARAGAGAGADLQWAWHIPLVTFATVRFATTCYTLQLTAERVDERQRQRWRADEIKLKSS